MRKKNQNAHKQTKVHLQIMKNVTNQWVDGILSEIGTNKLRPNVFLLKRARVSSTQMSLARIVRARADAVGQIMKCRPVWQPASAYMKIAPEAMSLASPDQAAKGKALEMAFTYHQLGERNDMMADYTWID